MSLRKSSVFFELLKFAAPTFLLTVVQALMNLTDMLIASNFGTVDIAAEVGMGGQMSYLIVTAIIGFSTGAAILFGKIEGRKDNDAWYAAINNYLTVSLIAAIAIAAIFIPTTQPLLRLFATPERAIGGAAKYFITQMGGMIFLLLFQAINAMFRGRGESLPPFVFLSLGAVLNVGLDFLFLIAFRWGAVGISLATVLAEVFSVLAGIVYIKKKKILSFKKLRLYLDKGITKNLLKLGVPLGIENTAASVSFLIMTFLVNRIGGADAVYALAASAICMRFNAFFMLPARATGMSVSAKVAQFLGAGDRSRARQTVIGGFVISLSAGLALTATTFFFAEGMIRLFGNDLKVIAFGVPYLKAFSFDYLILPLSVILFGWFDGLGKTGVSLTVNVLTSFVIRIPLAFLLSAVFGFGIVGLGVSIPLASAAAAAITITIFFVTLKKRKKEKSMQTEPRIFS